MHIEDVESSWQWALVPLPYKRKQNKPLTRQSLANWNLKPTHCSLYEILQNYASKLARFSEIHSCSFTNLYNILSNWLILYKAGKIILNWSISFSIQLEFGHVQVPVQNVSQIWLPGQFFSRFGTSVVNWHHFASNRTNGQRGRVSTPSNKAGFDAKSQTTRPRTSPAETKTQPLARPVMQAGICIFLTEIEAHST